MGDHYPTLPYEGIKTPFNPLGAVRRTRYRRLCGYDNAHGGSPRSTSAALCEDVQMGRQIRV